MSVSTHILPSLCVTLFLVACNANNAQRTPINMQTQVTMNNLPIPLGKPTDFDVFCAGETRDTLRAFYGGMLSQGGVNKIEVTNRYSYAVTGWMGRGNFVFLFRYEPGQRKGANGMFLKLDAFAFDYSGTDFITREELNEFKSENKWTPPSCSKI